MGSLLSALIQEDGDGSGDAPGYELVLHFHVVFRALCRGNDQRPGLPPELVLSIFRMARVALLKPSLDAVAAQSAVVRADNASIAFVDWFATAPFSGSTLRRIAAARLYTSSHDQGWADRRDQGSWTWFEICIASPGPNSTFVVAKRADDTELRWMSHKNEVATPSAQRLHGEFFDQSHELWQHLREGHIILVRACAQFGGWKNFALEGMLRFWTFFEPVLV